MKPDPQPTSLVAQIRRLPVPLPRRDGPALRLGRKAGWPHSALVVTPPRYALAHALTRSLGQALVSGNRVELLDTGEAARAEVFTAIDRAREHVNLASPATMLASVAASLAERLMVRASAGVRINLLPGGPRRSAADEAAVLRSAGIGVCGEALLPRLRSLLPGLAGPAGDSLVVVDGRTAFLGSLPAARSAGAVGTEGVCLRIEGPAVAQLQRLFIARWQRRCGTAPPAARYFPALAPHGVHRTALAGCEAGWQARPWQAALLAALQAAQQRVRLDGLPGAAVTQALALAAARGVRVQVLLPAARDSRVDRERRDALQAAGVALLRRRAGAAQGGGCVIDGVWSAIGCAFDFDRRLHGPETTLIVLDEGFASGLESRLEGQAALCQTLGPPGAATTGPGGDPGRSPAQATSAWQQAREWLAGRRDASR